MLPTSRKLAGDLYIADIDDCRIRSVTRGHDQYICGTGICGYSGRRYGLTSIRSFRHKPSLPVAVATFTSRTQRLVIIKSMLRVQSRHVLTTLTGSNGFSVPPVPIRSRRRRRQSFALGYNLQSPENPPSETRRLSPGSSCDPPLPTVTEFPATQAWFISPERCGGDSGVYISDWLNDRIRKVDTSAHYFSSGNRD